CGSTLPDFSQSQTQLKSFRTGDDGTSLRHYTVPALRTRLPDQYQHLSRFVPRGRKSAGTSLAPAEAERNTRSVAARVQSKLQNNSRENREPCVDRNIHS